MNGISKIVVATDFSDASDHAIDRALSLAESLKASVILVHAYGLPVYGFPDGVLLPSPEVAANISDVAQEALDRTLNRARERFSKVTGVLREGDAREEVEAVARDVGADLIVTGSHGRTGFKRWVLGSVADRIVHTSPIPVLVVPSAEVTKTSSQSVSSSPGAASATPPATTQDEAATRRFGYEPF